MHFPVLVISEQKPTEKVLGEILAPFMPEKFDWWTLGGRYTGNLTPFDFDNTITGGDTDLPAGEEMLVQMIAEASNGKSTLERPSCYGRGNGVDALQLSNLKSGFAFLRVVMNGKFLEAPIAPEDMFSIGKPLGRKSRKQAERWFSELPIVYDDQWAAVVDCHA